MSGVDGFEQRQADEADRQSRIPDHDTRANAADDGIDQAEYLAYWFSKIQHSPACITSRHTEGCLCAGCAAQHAIDRVQA